MKSEMKARISQLHKTAADWEHYSTKKLNANDPFIPNAGELIIYDPDETFSYARVKIGDGVHMLTELPFFIDPVIQTAVNQFTRTEIFDAGRITEYIIK